MSFEKSIEKSAFLSYVYNTIIAGWQCEMCREAVYIHCVKDMVEYNLRKMGMQWNMRKEIIEENCIEYER